MRTSQRPDLATQRSLVRQRAALMFDQMSEDGDWLLKGQIDRYLEKTLKIDGDMLEEDAVILVANTARRMQEKERLTPPPKKTGAIGKNALVTLLEKYGVFLAKSKEINGMHDKFAKEEKGYLSRDELGKMLQDYERKEPRSRAGLVVNLSVLESDINWIMEQSDVDGDGKIGRAECLPAVVAWEERVEMRLKETSSSCVIL